jgi:serine/threonine protein kinase
MIVQLLSALEYMHSEGFSHRDIKLENVLLDSEYNIKLADFGLASKSKSSRTQKGTVSYMAPEILSGEKYRTESADLYALAILMFSLLTKLVPFEKADPSDEHYSQILAGDWTKFWANIDANSGRKKTLSADFKELFEKMVAPKKEDRLTLEQVKLHKWVQGKTLSQKKIMKKFSENAGRTSERSNASTRPSSSEESPKVGLSYENMAVSDQKKQKACSNEVLAKYPRKYTRYFEESGEKFIALLVRFSNQYNLKSKVCPDFFRLIIELSGNSKKTLIQCNILKKEESGCRCAEAILISGLGQAFKNVFTKLEAFLKENTNHNQCE